MVRPTTGSAPGPTGSLPVVTAAFAAMLLGANLAGPLYAGYAERFGFSSALLALGAAIALAALMPDSDAGRAGLALLKNLRWDNGQRCLPPDSLTRTVLVVRDPPASFAPALLGDDRLAEARAPTPR